jgi:hypothetical protein
MIKDILKSIFVYIDKKVRKLAENETRLNCVEKDIENLNLQEEGRMSFSRGLYDILGDLKVIKNEIGHFSEFKHEIIERIIRLEDRLERRHIIQPIEYDRRQS